MNHVLINTHSSMYIVVVEALYGIYTWSFSNGLMVIEFDSSHCWTFFTHKFSAWLIEGVMRVGECKIMYVIL